MVTASTYYFTSQGSENIEGSGQVMTGFKWAWVNNIGSICYGSLLVAIIWVLRVVVYYLMKRLESISGDNGCAKCISCCVQCFMAWLQEIIEYINTSAYAYMAISGQRFCLSAYYGILLQMKHAGKFVFGNYIADGFVLIGKVGLTTLNIFISWIFMAKVNGNNSKLTSPYGPMLIIGLTSYAIVNVFLGLFDEAVLGIMTSCSADMDLNEGFPKWGPPTLHKIVTELFPPELRLETYSSSRVEDDGNDIKVSDVDDESH